MPTGAPQDASYEGVRRRLKSRAVQERFLHLAHYEGEPPSQGLLLGLQLSEAAARTRERGRA